MNRSILAAVGLLVTVGAKPAAACVCSGFPAFSDLARSAPVVLAGRVSALGSSTSTGPRYIDLEGVSVKYGSVGPPGVRVWEEGAGSSCGGVLSEVRVGEYVAVAAAWAASFDAERRAFWEDLGVKPSATDLLIAIQCGEPLKRLTSRRDRKRWLGR